jgi:Lon protease-like protein
MPVLPMFPLNSVVFPGQHVPLHVFEPRYRELIRDVLDGDGEFGIALIREGPEVGGGAVPVEIGCAVRIVDADELPDGRWEVVCEGTRRFRVVESLGEDPYLRCEVTFPESPTDIEDPATIEAAEKLRTTYVDHLRLELAINDAWQKRFHLPLTSSALADLVAGRIDVPSSVKQGVLEATNVAKQIEMLIKVLEVENAQLNLRLAAHQRKRYSGLGILN